MKLVSITFRFNRIGAVVPSIFLTVLCLLGLLFPQPVFGQHCSSALAAESEKFSSAKTEYFSNGSKRSIDEQGVIFEQRGMNWVQVGSGKVIGGTIYEKIDLNPQQIQSLPNRNSENNSSRLYLAGTMAPFRNSPVTRVVEFPSNRTRFESNVHILEVGKKAIELVIPKNFGLEKLLEGLTQTVLNLPYVNLEALKSIRVNPYACQDIIQSAFAGVHNSKPVIELFPLSFEHLIATSPLGVRILRHEFGHIIANKIFGRTDPSGQYIAQAREDRLGVSEYGNTHWAEDFAEAVESYLRTEAGSLAPEIRRQLSNRFAFLDQVFIERIPQSVNSRSYISKQTPENFHIVVTSLDSRNILILIPEIGRGLVFSLE